LTTPDPIYVNQIVPLELPMFFYDLSNDFDYDKIINQLTAYATSNPKKPEGQYTNIRIVNQGWHSGYLLHEQTKEFDYISEKILEKVRGIQQDFFGVLEQNVIYEICNLWGIIYTKDDYAEWHDHGRTLAVARCINFILYLNDGNNPLHIKQMDNVPNYKINPKKGLLVLMHPYILHRVFPFSIESKRYVIAGNIGPKLNAG
jgi:hypothetical protein